MENKFIPKQAEEELYRFWETSGIMTGDNTSKKKPFTIILPPPNANADLHLGHAMYVYEDIMIRFHKLLGFEVLWLPGADHAGFETQYVFEKHLAKKGESRFKYDRSTLYRMIWDFVHENRPRMENQLRRLGFFFAWSRIKLLPRVLLGNAIINAFPLFQKLPIAFLKVLLACLCLPSLPLSSLV